MQATDRKHFGEMLVAVAAVYGKDMSPAVVAIYFSALAPYDLAAVRQAFDRYVRNPDTGQFMPKPADLIRMIDGGTQDLALIAWTEVERSIRRIGSYADVEFADKRIHCVISDMGGWIRLCETTEESLPFVAKEFQTRYRAYSLRGEVPDATELIGRETAENARLGYAKKPPTQIGGPKRIGNFLGMEK
jgi:hypothetical protein